ncbi:MAG TPA: hypothetical protein VEA69_21125 [Tepidisphaeraceae bacterium]|nr:hypothetical protein [Tepidisphaeraceae bacterium]
MTSKEIKTEVAEWNAYAARNKDQFDSSTLGQPVGTNEYLANRIRRAFQEGYEAGLKAARQTALDAVAKLLDAG